MENLFLSGSLKIKNLHPVFKKRISKAASEGFGFLVGDASGSDSSIQELLSELKVNNVTVYCSGSTPRNNLGNWPVNNVFPSAPEGTRAYFTAKDVQMADDASGGIMIWDAASTGTLSNVFELIYRNRESEVFVNKLKKFIAIKSPVDVSNLVSMMSPAAFDKANKKIGISKKIERINPSQSGFDF